jgi:hypothetical protein
MATSSSSSSTPGALSTPPREAPLPQFLADTRFDDFTPLFVEYAAKNDATEYEYDGIKHPGLRKLLTDKDSELPTSQSYPWNGIAPAPASYMVGLEGGLKKFLDAQAIGNNEPLLNYTKFISRYIATTIAVSKLIEKAICTMQVGLGFTSPPNAIPPYKCRATKANSGIEYIVKTAKQNNNRFEWEISPPIKFVPPTPITFYFGVFQTRGLSGEEEFTWMMHTKSGSPVRVTGFPVLEISPALISDGLGIEVGDNVLLQVYLLLDKSAENITAISIGQTFFTDLLLRKIPRDQIGPIISGSKTFAESIQALEKLGGDVRSYNMSASGDGYRFGIWLRTLYGAILENPRTEVGVQIFAPPPNMAAFFCMWYIRLHALLLVYEKACVQLNYSALFKKALFKQMYVNRRYFTADYWQLICPPWRYPKFARNAEHIMERIRTINTRGKESEIAAFIKSFFDPKSEVKVDSLVNIVGQEMMLDYDIFPPILDLRTSDRVSHFQQMRSYHARYIELLFNQHTGKIEYKFREVEPRAQNLVNYPIQQVLPTNSNFSAALNTLHICGSYYFPIVCSRKDSYLRRTEYAVLTHFSFGHSVESTEFNLSIGDYRLPQLIGPKLSYQQCFLPNKYEMLLRKTVFEYDYAEFSRSTVSKYIPISDIYINVNEFDVLVRSTGATVKVPSKLSISSPEQATIDDIISVIGSTLVENFADLFVAIDSRTQNTLLNLKTTISGIEHALTDSSINSMRPMLAILEYVCSEGIVSSIMHQICLEIGKPLPDKYASPSHKRERVDIPVLQTGTILTQPPSTPISPSIRRTLPAPMNVPLPAIKPLTQTVVPLNLPQANIQVPTSPPIQVSVPVPTPVPTPISTSVAETLKEKDIQKEPEPLFMGPEHPLYDVFATDPYENLQHSSQEEFGSTYPLSPMLSPFGGFLNEPSPTPSQSTESSSQSSIFH